MPEFKTKEEYEKWKAVRLQKATKPQVENIEPKPQVRPKAKKPTEKKCRHCAMMIPFEARICPHCRKSQPSTAKAIIIIGIILLFLGPCFIALITHKETTPQKNTEYPTEIDACVQSTHIVENNLKSPSSAKFPWVCSAFRTPAGAWSVHSYVDAQNSFGAMIRTNYIWTAEYNKDKNEWNIIYFKLGDEELIKG
jgi:hypothetical protein